MTPDNFTVLIEKIDLLSGEIERVGIVATVVLVIQILTGIALVFAHNRIAKNQVATAELLEQAVAKIESDLPKK